MLIKNSLRLLINNLNLVFKAMLYSLIVVFLAYLLITASFSDFLSKISQSSEFQTFFNDLTALWNAFITGDFSPSVDLVASFEGLMDAVSRDFGNYTLTIIALGAGSYFIVVLNGLSSYTLTYLMNARMSAYEKKSFLPTLISTLKKSLPFEALFSLLSIIAFSAALFFAVIFVVYTFSYIYLLSLIIGIWLFIVLFSLYLSVTATFRPLIVKGSKIKELFRIRYAAADFWKVLASYIFSLVIAFSLNVVMFTSTLGAGLVISLPIAQLYFILFSLVLLYTTKGMKYYIDYETIVVPNKLKEDSAAADFLDDIEI